MTELSDQLRDIAYELENAEPASEVYARGRTEGYAAGRAAGQNDWNWEMAFVGFLAFAGMLIAAAAFVFWVWQFIHWAAAPDGGRTVCYQSSQSTYCQMER